MEIVIVWIEQFLRAGLQLWIHPFYYIAIFIVVLQYHRQMYLERKMFHTKLHAYIHETWKTLLWGIVAGFFVSLTMSVVGVVVQIEAVIILWVIAILLSIVRIRFISIAYAVGVIGLLHAVLDYFPQARLSELNQIEGTVLSSWLMTIENAILYLNMSTLFVLIAVLYFVEAILIRSRKTRLERPLYVEGKRGKIVGGYQIQGMWPIPLFLCVPVHGGTELPIAWTPLFGGDIWANGLTLLAFPVLIGISSWTKTVLPQEKAQWTSKYLIGYSVIMLGLAIAVEFWSGLTFTAALLCIVLLEALVWYSSWKETQLPPRYIHSDQGLLILGTIAGSPAEEMGILPGEMIRQVNGKIVRSSVELHEAFRISPTMYKFEIINLEGNSKFLQRAVYADDHYQLGIILAPDENTQFYMEMQRKSHSLISYFHPKFADILRKGQGSKFHNL